MSYQKQFGKYAVKIGVNTVRWFKDFNKAQDLFNFYKSCGEDDPEEIDNEVLTLVDIQQNKVLDSFDPN